MSSAQRRSKVYEAMNRNDLLTVLAAVLRAAESDIDAAPTEAQSVRAALAELARDFDAADLLREAQEMTAAQAAARFAASAYSMLAFEAATCICSANRLRTDAETRFLAEFGRRLGLTQPQVVRTAAIADALATQPLAETSEPQDRTRDSLDRLILDASMRAARLQPLCHPTTALAVLAIQQNLISAIAARFGHTIDRPRMRGLAAAAGLGFCGEYLQLLGACLLREMTAAESGLVGQPADGAQSFCTTFALGHAIRRSFTDDGMHDPLRLSEDFARLKPVARRQAARLLNGLK
jgi:uncharacterized protein (DUF697 family)